MPKFKTRAELYAFYMTAVDREIEQEDLKRQIKEGKLTPSGKKIIKFGEIGKITRN